MVRWLRVVGLETRGMHQAAYLLAFFAFASQLLALVRDRLLAANFGAGGTLDLYYAAFRVPDFLFATVASLLSLYALLPILSKLEQEKEGYMVSFMRQMLFLFFIGMGAVCAIAALFAPEIVRYTAPGFLGDPEKFGALVLLTRILLLQPVLLGASNILANLTQLRARFLLYSISPLLYNLGIIFGVVALYPRLGVVGLGWGVVLGAALHALVQVPFFAAERSAEPLPLSRAFAELRRVLALSVPRTFALASTQVSLLALTALASYLAKGSIAIFNFAYNLQAVPLTIIGVSYSVAAFPTLARLHAAGEHAEFGRRIETALRHILFWSIPATVFVIVLRAQLVRVILGAGAFDWTATRLTAAALALFILSLAAQNITLLIARTYYAAGNTKKPLYWGCLDIIVSIFAAYCLAAWFNENAFVRDFTESLLRVDAVGGTAVLMLALGYALGSIVECLVGIVVFVRDFSLSAKGLWRLAFESLAASLIGGTASYEVLSYLGTRLNLNTSLGVFLQGFAGGLVGLALAVLILFVMRNRELSEIATAFSRRFARREEAVAVEPSDIAS